MVQHILFGSLFPLKLAKPNTGVRKMRMSLTPAPSSMKAKLNQEVEKTNESTTSVELKDTAAVTNLDANDSQP